MAKKSDEIKSDEIDEIKSEPSAMMAAPTPTPTKVPSWILMSVIQLHGSESVAIKAGDLRAAGVKLPKGYENRTGESYVLVNVGELRQQLKYN